MGNGPAPLPQGGLQSMVQRIPQGQSYRPMFGSGGGAAMPGGAMQNGGNFAGGSSNFNEAANAVLQPLGGIGGGQGMAHPDTGGTIAGTVSAASPYGAAYDGGGGPAPVVGGGGGTDQRPPLEAGGGGFNPAPSLNGWGADMNTMSPIANPISPEQRAYVDNIKAQHAGMTNRGIAMTAMHGNRGTRIGENGQVSASNPASLALRAQQVFAEQMARSGNPNAVHATPTPPAGGFGPATTQPTTPAAPGMYWAIGPDGQPIQKPLGG